MTTTTAETYEERLDREKRDRRETAENAARTVSAAMSKHTGEHWTATTDPDHYAPTFAMIRERDGLSIRAALTTRTGKSAWNVYPGHVTAPDGNRIWLYDHRKHGEDTDANIGQTKSPEQIARDTIRRVLPIAEELARRALEARATHLDRQAWLDRTAAHMIAVTRERIPLRLCHHDEKSTRRELRHCGKPYVTLTLDAYDRQVKVEIDDLAPEIALAMLAQLPVAAPEPEEAEA
jgi:hypothetical protein